MYSIPIRLLEYPEDVMAINVSSSKSLSKCFSSIIEPAKIIIAGMVNPPALIVSTVVIQSRTSGSAKYTAFVLRV